MAQRRWRRAAARALCGAGVLLALFALLPGALPAAHAACREAAVATLPMPAWTWLRSWRADFASPTRIALDPQGRVLATDPPRGRLVLRNPDGALGGVLRGLGHPVSVAADARGGLWVGDGQRGRVTLHAADGTPRFALGSGDGEFGLPGDIAIDPVNGDLYVSDAARHVVAVYSGAGARLRTIGGPAATDGAQPADGLFRVPTGVLLAGDELLVADQLNFRVQAFDKASGAFRYCVGTYRSSSFFNPAGGPARILGMPQGLAVDALGRLYVADAFQGEVRVIDRSNGALIGSIGVAAGEPGALRVPTDVLIDGAGRLVVASADGARLDLFALDGAADPERFAPATVQLAPARIDRAQPAAEVVAAIEVPGYRAIDIDAASVRANGLPVTPLEVGDRDGNGIPELRVAVGGAALLPTLGGGESAAVTLAGAVGGLRFEATATIALTGLPPAGDGDADDDGVADQHDACPGTAAGAPVDRAGCAVAQRCPCSGPAAGKAWRNHGAYVRCVEEAARRVAQAQQDRHGEKSDDKRDDKRDDNRDDERDHKHGDKHEGQHVTHQDGRQADRHGHDDDRRQAGPVKTGAQHAKQWRRWVEQVVRDAARSSCGRKP